MRAVRESGQRDDSIGLASALLLGGLLFRFGVSVMSDAVEMVATGGELTLVEAVDWLA